MFKVLGHNNLGQFIRRLLQSGDDQSDTESEPKGSKKVKRSGTSVNRSKLPVPPPPPPEHTASKHSPQKDRKSASSNDVRKSKSRDSKSKFYTGSDGELNTKEVERSSSTFYVHDDLEADNVDIPPAKEESLKASTSDDSLPKVNTDSNAKDGEGIKPSTKPIQTKSPKLPPKPRVSRPAPPPPKKRPGQPNSAVNASNSTSLPPGGAKPTGPPPPIPSKPPVGDISSVSGPKERPSAIPVPPVRRNKSVKPNDPVLKTAGSLDNTEENKTDTAPEQSACLNETEKNLTDILENSECLNKPGESDIDITEIKNKCPVEPDIPEKSECLGKTEQSETDISENKALCPNEENVSDFAEIPKSPAVAQDCDADPVESECGSQAVPEGLTGSNHTAQPPNETIDNTEHGNSNESEIQGTSPVTSVREETKSLDSNSSGLSEQYTNTAVKDNIIPDDNEDIASDQKTGDDLNVSGDKTPDNSDRSPDNDRTECGEQTETISAGEEGTNSYHTNGSPKQTSESAEVKENPKKPLEQEGLGVDHQHLCNLLEEEHTSSSSEDKENSVTPKPRQHLLRSSKNSRKTLYPPTNSGYKSGPSSKKSLDEPKNQGTDSADNKRKSSSMPSIMRDKKRPPRLGHQGSGKCNSFTTEDKDLFCEKTKGTSPHNSPDLKDRGRDITRKKDGSNSTPRETAMYRRRSKSVGATDFYSSKPLQLPTKPKIPVKPKPRIPRKPRPEGSQISRIDPLDSGGDNKNTPDSSPNLIRKTISPTLEAVKSEDSEGHSPRMSPEVLRKHMIKEAVPTQGLHLTAVSKPKVPKRNDIPAKPDRKPVSDDKKTSPFGVKLKHVTPTPASSTRNTDAGNNASTGICKLKPNLNSHLRKVGSPPLSAPVPAKRPALRPPPRPKTPATKADSSPEDEQGPQSPCRPIRRKDSLKTKPEDMTIGPNHTEGEKAEEEDKNCEITETELKKVSFQNVSAVKQGSACDSVIRYDHPEDVDTNIEGEELYTEVKEDIYEVVDVVGPAPPPPSPPPLPPPNQKPAESELSREERKLQRKVSRKASMARRVARKQSRRESMRRKRENPDEAADGIYSTIGEDDFEDEDGFAVEDFSGSDEGSWSESSFTDNSDLEFEDELKNELRNKHSIYGTAPLRSDPDVPEFVPIDECHKIVHELLTTERSYVNKLHLIDQIFHFQVVVHNRAEKMFPPDAIPKMFSNVKSIYQFHHDFLLPQLEERFKKWEDVSKIGDLIKGFAPFLKIYSEYIKNYDTANQTIAFWQDKSPAFADLIDELQKKPECGSLRLLDHMLGPIQRIPRYEMLLKDYLRHLPSDSKDKKDTEVALDLVVKAATHSNEAMRKIDKFRKLLEIGESLIGEVDLILPGRELIKEGKITKISGRKGEQFERYLFLFNDMLLVCHNVSLVGLKHQYKIKTKLDVEGMRVMEGDNLGATTDTFHVKGKQKSLELLASSAEEKVEWQTTLWKVINEFTKKQLSRHGNLSHSLDQFRDDELGTRAPTWIRDKDTSMCMQCSVGFTMVRRRHHCRACGMVVCHGCSTHKTKLAYDNDKENRVCDKCFLILEGRSDEFVPTNLPGKRTILKVKANDPSVLAGYLQCSTDKKTWNRRWLSVRDDFVMYFFKAHQDVVAEGSLPLPGFSLKEVKIGPQTFKLYYQGKTGAEKEEHFFQADDNSTCKRWIEVLSKLVKLELPDNTITPRSSAATS